VAPGAYKLFFETFVLREFLPGINLSTKIFTGSSTATTSRWRKIPRRAAGLILAAFARSGRRLSSACRCSDRAITGARCAGRGRTSIVLGLNHEQQHQELALTDINCVLRKSFTSCLRRECGESAPKVRVCSEAGLDSLQAGWQRSDIRYRTTSMDFCFDNETPRHTFI